jgi:hypothetical protein
VGLICPTTIVPRPGGPRRRLSETPVWAGSPGPARDQSWPNQPIPAGTLCAHAVVATLRPRAMARPPPALQPTWRGDVAGMSNHSDWGVHLVAPEGRGLTQAAARRGGSRFTWLWWPSSTGRGCGGRQQCRSACAVRGGDHP